VQAADTLRRAEVIPFMAARICSPGPTDSTARGANGEILHPPPGWILLPPGDAALTRRVKEAGDHWVVQEKRGRKTFSRGVWADRTTVERIRADLAAERATAAFAKRQAAAATRRERAQGVYVDDFRAAVVAFLGFHERHASSAAMLADAVTAHATPVGSGTVARTRRIPIERRAEAAVVAWMRHQTTAYESMPIPRVKGKRREVRRMLAARSKELLARYRRGEPTAASCPLAAVLVTPAHEAPARAASAERGVAAVPSGTGRKPDGR
jgi:hypothetical protein